MKSDVVLDVGESYLTRLKYNVKKRQSKGKWMPLSYFNTIGKSFDADATDARKCI